MILILRPRKFVNGWPQWHDSDVLDNAIAAIVRGKSIGKMQMWLDMARKIEEARETANDFNKTRPEITIELSSAQAKKLLDEIKNINPEQLGVNPMTLEPMAPPLGVLVIMLEDFAAQLGQELTFSQKDED